MACSSYLSLDNLGRFRTKTCIRQQTKVCNFGEDRCQYSHNKQWVRRGPFYTTELQKYEALKYLPYPCPDIEFDEALNGKKSNCPRGSACPLAHSAEEVIYHPMIYKKYKCSKPLMCSTYYCPFSHAENEHVRRDATYVVKFIDDPSIVPVYPEVTYFWKKRGNQTQTLQPIDVSLLGSAVKPWNVENFLNLINEQAPALARVQTTPSTKRKVDEPIFNRSSNKASLPPMIDAYEAYERFLETSKVDSLEPSEIPEIYMSNAWSPLRQLSCRH